MAVTRKPERLSEDDVKAILADEITAALSEEYDSLSAQRARALRFYRGDPFGNEQEGRSQVVLTDVRDTVEAIMPDLMRMYLGGHNVVSYQPTSEEDIAGAKQASQYMNHVVLDENDGFMVFYDVMKTALIEKLGILKVEYEERLERKKHKWQGIDELQLAILADDATIEIVAAREYEESLGERNPETGEPVLRKLFDVEAVQVAPRGRLKITGVPPEDFLVSPGARALDEDVRFVGDRRKMTRSDLIALGFDADKVLSIAVGDESDYSEGRAARFGYDIPGSGEAVDRKDPASDELWVYDCYPLIDEDGDGYAERRHIVAVGCPAGASPEILLDEEVGWHPYSSITPVPMPYRLVGDGMADLVSDLQLIRSTLLRQILDNVYFQNNSRLEVVEGNVVIEDLLTSVPGGVVRVTAPGQVNPIVSAPLSPMAFNTLEYLHGVKENRTGVTRYNQGMDASSLNQTARGISAIMGAAQSRIELIARVFAATGIKRAFRLALKVLSTSPLKKQVVRLRGEWVSFDPGTWNPEMDVRIEVGLGTGRAQEQIQNLSMVMNLQKEIAGAGLGFMVTPENVYAAASKIAESAGFMIEGQFFSDPKGQEPPPPPPEPKMLEIEAKTQTDAKRLEIEERRLAKEQEDQGRKTEINLLKMETEREIAMERIRSQERIAMKKLEIDARKLQVEAAAPSSEGSAQ